MNISGSLIQAYLICPRQSWLMSRNLSGDQYNEFITIGRLYSDESYKRDKKEIHINGNIIDVIKKQNGETILIETKKSSRAIEASKFQLLFYMKNLKSKIKNIKAEIRIPKEKKIIQVEFNDENEKDLNLIIAKIYELVERDSPPKVNKNKYCTTCSHFEFCWS